MIQRKPMKNNTHSGFSLIRINLLVIGVIALVACEPKKDISDLKTYIAKIKTNTPIKTLDADTVTPTDTTVKQPENTSLRNPFAPIQEEKKLPQHAKLSINRIKEPLEFVPLAQLQFVGTIQIDALFWALVRDNQNTIHRLKIGHYLGENAGKITHIDATKIDFVEMIPNEQGEYTTRSNHLLLTQ